MSRKELKCYTVIDRWMKGLITGGEAAELLSLSYRQVCRLKVFHDINLAARYADYIFALHQGKLKCEGKPSEVITSAAIKDIFGLDCTVMQDPFSGSPFVVPKGRYRVNH